MSEASLFGILIQPNSIYCGIHLKEIQLPEKCNFLGILREEQVIPAQENPEIYSGDYILSNSKASHDGFSTKSHSQ